MVRLGPGNTLNGIHSLIPEKCAELRGVVAPLNYFMHVDRFSDNMMLSLR